MLTHSRSRPRPWKADHQQARMNRLEADYAKRLEARRCKGDIVSWSYRSIELRLADGVWFVPGFTVMTIDTIELHEVMGGCAYTSRLEGKTIVCSSERFKVCAEQRPEYRFVKAERVGGRWIEEVYGEDGGH